MKDDDTWLHLIYSFAPLSFLTIGGGQSVVSDIHRQSVEVYGWMTDAQFMDLFALSRLTPGPGSLLVAMIGWRAGGWMGAVLAFLCIFLPTSVFIYGLAHLWSRHREATWTRAVEAGLAPVAAGMVMAAAFTVLKAAEGGVLAWIVAAAATACFVFTRISPFLLLIAGALTFIVAAPTLSH